MRIGTAKVSRRGPDPGPPAWRTRSHWLVGGVAIALLLLWGPVFGTWIAEFAPASVHPGNVRAATVGEEEHEASRPGEAHEEHGEAHGEKHGEVHEEHDEEHPELPNLIHLFYKAMGGAEGRAPTWVETLHHFQDTIFALLVTGIMVLVVHLGTRRMALIPGRMQNAVESFVEGFSNFIEGILGRENGRRYVPFLGTLFVYIWWMNLFGLVPLMRSPTSVLSTTAGLAVCVFFYVQWTGIRRLGLGNYLLHLAGDPKDAVGWALSPLMLPLHVIGELSRPVSLSLRLFGNILGEDILLGVFAGLGVAILAFMKLPIGVPLHLPFILLAMLMSTVQALVFTLLSTIYILQMLPHDHAESHAAVPSEGEPAAGGA